MNVTGNKRTRTGVDGTQPSTDFAPPLKKLKQSIPTPTLSGAITLNTSEEAKMLESNVKFKQRFDLENEISSYLDENDIRKLIFDLSVKFPNIFSSIRQKMQYHSTLCKVFIRSLPYHTKENELRKLFEQFGTVNEACIIPDKNTKKSRVCTH